MTRNVMTVFTELLNTQLNFKIVLKRNLFFTPASEKNLEKHQ